MTETQTTEILDTATELDELRHFRTTANAELEALRPLALQSAIRSAGYEPTSSAGRVLAELTKTDPQLAASPEALRRKASALGLSPNVVADPVPDPSASSELIDPSLPATHSVNVAGTPAHDQALAQKALRDPLREVAERMLSPTTYEDARPSPLREAAEQLAAKWNPASPQPNPWRAQTVDVPPLTAAQQQENRDAFEDRQKTAKKELRDVTRAVARRMVR